MIFKHLISEAIPRCLHRGYCLSGIKLFVKKFYIDTSLLAAESFISSSCGERAG